MKNWQTPRVLVEKYASNEFVSSCTNTVSGVNLWAPCHESNNVPGFQEHNEGYDIDAIGHNEDGWFFIPEGHYRLVDGASDEFPNDTSKTYFMVELSFSVTGKDHKTGQPTNTTYGPGDILYKLTTPGNYEEIVKNFS